MKWVNLTDALFFKAAEYLFMISRERRMGSYDWSVLKDKDVVFEGTSSSIGAAKTVCKEIFKKIKEENKMVRVKKNGKLTYK